MRHAANKKSGAGIPRFAKRGRIVEAQSAELSVDHLLILKSYLTGENEPCRSIRNS